MSDGFSDLKRVVSSSGVYAAAALAQRGIAFVLLPVYTRFLDPVEYGKLELLTALSFLAFGLLVVGLPSAIMKCYHRDCDTAADRARIVATACAIAIPLLIGGSAVIFAAAPRIAIVAIGSESAADLVRIAVTTGLLTSVVALILAGLRAEERALAFSVLTVSQFLLAVLLNITFVVYFGLGVRGILWGNLLSNAAALLLAVLAIRQSSTLGFAKKLVRPMLTFGLLIVPVTLSMWIINLSDRYIIRLFAGLGDVAVYGVGYKFGMLIELFVVWPFQLAWPAVSFSISKRDGHRTTYARTLTYLTAILVYLVVALSLTTRVLVPAIVGEAYREAYRVVPPVALAYALNGIMYCVSPGVHISGKTRYLTVISLIAAGLNLALNFYLIPSYGVMGAAWATAGSFLLIAAVTGIVAQHFYYVEYEYSRLAKIIIVGLVIYLGGSRLPADGTVLSALGHLSLGVLAFPLSILALRVLDQQERDAVRRLCRQAFTYFPQRHR